MECDSIMGFPWEFFQTKTKQERVSQAQPRPRQAVPAVTGTAVAVWSPRPVLPPWSVHVGSEETAQHVSGRAWKRSFLVSFLPIWSFTLRKSCRMRGQGEPLAGGVCPKLIALHRKVRGLPVAVGILFILLRTGNKPGLK